LVELSEVLNKLILQGHIHQDDCVVKPCGQLNRLVAWDYFLVF
jgi:hypothetical protein